LASIGTLPALTGLLYLTTYKTETDKKNYRHVRLVACLFDRCDCRRHPSYGWTKRDTS